MKSKLLELFLLIIVLSSFLTIHWHNIESTPYGIEGDEKSWIISSLANKYGVDATNFNIFVGHRVDQKNFPVSVVLNKVSFWLFGENFISPRKLLLLLNIFSLVIFYLICRNFLSPYVSLITAALYAFSTINLITSRIAIIGSYTRICFLPAIYLAIKATKTSFKKAVVIAVFSGLFTLLALLTYNTTYLLLPLVALYLAISFQKKFSLFKALVLILFFLLPVIFGSAKIYTSFQQQSSKAYVFNDAVSLKDSPKVMIKKITNSVISVKGEFFGTFIPDMLANWPTSLFNISISFLSTLGLVIILAQSIRSDRYLFLVVWSLMYLIAFHSILGFNYPRMWISSSALVYILAGIPLEKSREFISKYTNKIILILFFTLIAVFTLTTARADYGIYQNHAIKNASFTAPIMEEARNLFSILTDSRNKITVDNYLLLEENQALSDNSLPILLFSYLGTQSKIETSQKKETEILNLLTNNTSTVDSLPGKIKLREIKENKNKSVIIIPLRLSDTLTNIIDASGMIRDRKDEKYYRIIYF